MIRVAIIQFPGSNCEREAMLAVRRAGMEPIEFLWNEPKEKLETMDAYLIVGGFSYEDRSRAGIIAALDPIMRTVTAQSEMGKPVLGICNGAQILVETGLVPGLERYKIGMSLSENKRMVGQKVLGTGFYNAWIKLRLAHEYQRNAFTRCLTAKDIISMPVAHGEGRFVIPEALWQEIKMQGLAIFQYCDNDGGANPNFPVNPNGSLANIAAVANKAGNVLAIMPHPERTENGDPIFHSMREYITEGRTEKVAPLHYYPRPQVIRPFSKATTSHECIVELMITDNQALTVQNCLQQLGIAVTVRRQVHWEVHCDSVDIWQQVKKSGVLFNNRKEVEVTEEVQALAAMNAPAMTRVMVLADGQDMSESRISNPARSCAFLVRVKEEVVGLQKQQILEDHFGIEGLQAIQQSVLWHFTAENARINDLIEPILQTHIIFNPYGHDYYRYY